MRSMPGGVLEQLDEVEEEGVAGGVVEGLGFVEGVDIADDGFGGFEDSEGVAVDAAGGEGGVAGEDAAIEVLEEGVGGAGVVPEEAKLPAFGFVAEEGAGAARRRSGGGREFRVAGWVKRPRVPSRVV